MDINNTLIKNLISLNLPSRDYAVFGSGPMFAAGIKELGHDIDLIARGKAWSIAEKLSVPKVTISGNGKVVTLFDERIEIFDNWTPGSWDIHQLIDQADIIDGIKFVKLSEVLKWKKIWHREKDIAHIKLIEQYLEKIKN
ncbi:hypothetical protein KJ678_04540 [Patescibacteria group bacterium]|nr:hypothetical protein [Patescibacteria group bacterium]